MTRQEFVDRASKSQRALRRFLTALCCGDGALADDISQETLLKAWMACDNLRNDSGFEAWLFRIAYNTFLNSRRNLHFTECIDAAADVGGDNSSDEAFRYQELYRALELLPENERATILLFYIQGYQIKEISEISGSSIDAVKQQLSRGRYRLKNILSV